MKAPRHSRSVSNTGRWITDKSLTARTKRRYGEGVIIDTAVYADGRLTASETIAGALQTRQGSDDFACIVLHEPHQEELDSLAGGLQVERARIEQAIQRPRRAGIQPFGNPLCVWLACACYRSGAQALQVGWICVLLGEGLVVAMSFDEGLEVLKAVRRRMEVGSDRLWRSPGDVLREIADAVFDGKSGRARRIHALTRVVVELHQVTEPRAVGRSARSLPRGRGCRGARAPVSGSTPYSA